MPRTKKKTEPTNSFDLLCEILPASEELKPEEAYKRVREAIESGKLSQDAIVELLVCASAMPNIVAENMQLTSENKKLFRQVLAVSNVPANLPLNQKAN